MLDLIAVWLLERGYAENFEQGLRFAHELDKNKCSEEMIAVLSKNIDIFMNVGQPIVEKTLLPYMLDKFNTASKLIKFWIANPKDTNAVFFFNACKSHGIERPQVG